MENHHAFNGKTHYFDWAMFNSKLLNYRRGKHGDFINKAGGLESESSMGIE